MKFRTPHYTLTILFLYYSLFGFSQVETKPTNTVQKYADEMVAYKNLKHAPFGFHVENLDNNTVVADINGDISIPAASTMKLVTTSTAIKILGSKYRFKTKIAYSGYIDSTTQTLHGDLYVIGGGDPTLGSKYYNKAGHQKDFLTKWADTISNLGIKNIDGRVIGDASIYNYQGVPSGWVWGDLGNYYGAGPSGLTVFDNMLKLHFKTGKNIGDSTEIICTEPYLPNLIIQNGVKSAKSKKDNAYVYSAPYSNYAYVKGSLHQNEEDFTVKASLPDPEFVVAYEFDYALNQAGIKTKYYPTTNRLLQNDPLFVKPDLNNIYTHTSPSITSIINWTNQRSVNLFAEHLLCQISVKRSGYGSTYNGCLIAMGYWRSKIDATGLFMTDGSGLSRSNAVSPKFFVGLLKYMKGSKMLKNSLAIAGKKGTMASIGRKSSATGRVIGKSGTMTRMKAYTGYVTTKTGKHLAYAMVLNNYNCPTSTVKKYFQTLMIKMAEY
jgi:D-alanyl-D-alanine carboxypeptidase/D-alanyl-D-alanine-endopeptidase (penicillin-binding protein 4)